MRAEMIFTWNLDIESFNKIRERPNLLDLHRPFELRRYSLSRSLLIWHQIGVSDGWSLSDIAYEKFYHILKGSRHTNRSIVRKPGFGTTTHPPLNYNPHGPFRELLIG